MHILASGPEQQAVYFGHVIQTESGEKRGLALRSLMSNRETHMESVHSFALYRGSDPK
jgi:hypothetical protein